MDLITETARKMRAITPHILRNSTSAKTHCRSAGRLTPRPKLSAPKKQRLRTRFALADQVISSDMAHINLYKSDTFSRADAARFGMNGSRIR